MTAQTKKTVMLIVEDDALLQEILSKAFASDEFYVVSVRTGAEGVEQARRICPNIILLDLLLPDIDGFEVLRKIKQDEMGRKSQVILLSNLDEVGDMERALSLGATTYLVKANYSLPQIVERVKLALKECNELCGL